MALSRTDRVTTCWALNPPQPSPCGDIETRPREGLRPNTPQSEAGVRIDPPPSLACAAGTIPAATAAAAPPDEPPVIRSVFQGLRAGPKRRGSVIAASPNSGVFVLPKRTRPALR